MDELLNFRIADTVSVKAILVLVVAVAALRFAWRLIKPAAPDPGHIKNLACGACGWRGKTSIHARKCPKCSGPLFPDR